MSPTDPGQFDETPTLPKLGDVGYEKLLDGILNGALPAGTVLNERRLAANMNISRTPVRDALRRLESEGLVERRPGQAPTVVAPSIKDFVDVLAVRRLLETEAARLAVGNVPRGEIAAARQLVETLLQRGSTSVSESWRVDDTVHGLLAQNCGNAHLADMIVAERRRTHIFDTDRLPERFLPGCREHLTILDALEAGDRDKVMTSVGRHIDNVKQSILSKLQDR